MFIHVTGINGKSKITVMVSHIVYFERFEQEHNLPHTNLRALGSNLVIKETPEEIERLIMAAKES